MERRKLSAEEKIIYKDRVEKYCNRNKDYSIKNVNDSVGCGEYHTRILIKELIEEGLIEKSGRKIGWDNRKKISRTKKGQFNGLKVFDCEQICLLIEEFFSEAKDFEVLKENSLDMLVIVYRDMINLFSKLFDKEFRYSNLKTLEKRYDDLYFKSLDEKIEIMVSNKNKNLCKV